MIAHVSLSGIDEANSDQAYERILPEAMQLPPEQVRDLNLDVNNIVIIAIAAAKRLPSFEDELRALPGFPGEQLDRLADYTLALYCAHLRYCYASRPAEKLPGLHEAAIRWRDILLAEAKSLAVREHIRAELLKKLVNNHGYRKVAQDLAGLAQIFKDNWERIKDDTGLKRAHIEEADKLALKLTGAVAQREKSPEQIVAARDIRARIFTLLCRAYDHVRRGIHYLRWHKDDAESFVPSLYSGRRHATTVKESNGEQPGLTATEIANSNAGPIIAADETATAASEAAYGSPRAPTELPVWAPTSNRLFLPLPSQNRALPAPSESSEARSPGDVWRQLETKIPSPLAPRRRRKPRKRAPPGEWR